MKLLDMCQSDRVANLTDDVDVFNVLAHHSQSSESTTVWQSLQSNVFPRSSVVKHVGEFYDNVLYNSMNGPVREKLKINLKM